MARRLRRTVYVDHPDTQKNTMIPGGTVPPDWAAGLITNPSAWAPDPEPAPVVVEPAPVVVDPFDELGSKPYNTVTEIRDWVGNDQARAIDAMRYETDPDDPRPGSGQNRPTLIAYAAGVIG